MKALLPVALLMGSLVAPAGASALENFNYDAGYRACVRWNFTYKTREEWNEMNKWAKDKFRMQVHKSCR